MGYVAEALSKTSNKTDRALYARHMAEMQMVLDVVTPPTNTVLKILGQRVAGAEEERDALLEQNERLVEQLDKANQLAEDRRRALIDRS